MINTEHVTIGNMSFVRTYSDAGYKIHGGSPEGDYDEAVDPAEAGRTYTETDIPIEQEDTQVSEAEEIIGIILGEDEV